MDSGGGSSAQPGMSGMGIRRLRRLLKGVDSGEAEVDRPLRGRWVGIVGCLRDEFTPALLKTQRSQRL